MSTLVGRQAIKDFANINRADTRWDDLLDLAREDVSRQVEEITARTFDKRERTELHPSYHQMFGDPAPQYVIVDAPPIDTALTVTLIWAPFDDHTNNGTPLTTPEDWKFETDKQGDAWAIRVQRFTSLPQNLPLPQGAIGVLGDSPTGFQVTYTGGYAVSAVIPSSDPIDAGEQDVVQVPTSLASLLAQKIADDFRFFVAGRRLGATDPDKILEAGQQAGGFGATVSPGIVRPWTDAQIARLLTFGRKDLTWAGPRWAAQAGRATGDR